MIEITLPTNEVRRFHADVYKYRITEGGALLVFGRHDGELHEAFGPIGWLALSVSQLG